jgi:sugar porter (SP) family MFS transporter
MVSFVRKLSLIASLSGLLFGYDTGVVSGAVIFVRSYMSLDDKQVELMVSITIIAAAASAAAGGPLMAKFGRKLTLIFASIIFIIGSLVMAFAYGPYEGYWILVIGRTIVGVGIGFASEAGPIYIAEAAPPDQRGGLITLFNIAVVGGQVAASVVCGSLSYLEETISWRIMFGVGCLPALLQLLGFLFLPKSPQWLVMKDRTEEAEQVLQRIRMKDDIQQELKEIIDTADLAKAGEQVSLFQLWWNNAPVRRAMIIGCLLWVISQLAGINTIMYYGATIVQMSGITDNLEMAQSDSFDIWLTVPLYSAQLFGILVCMVVIDCLGRRKTVLVSLAFVFIFLVMIGLGFSFDKGTVSVIGMAGYLFAFGFGLSTMPYTINAEIYPIQYRSKCVAQATCLFWISNFLVSVTFLTLTSVIGEAGTFYLYAGIVVVGSCLIWWLLPETSGVSLENMHTLFEKKPNSDKTIPPKNPTPAPEQNTNKSTTTL